MALIPRGADLPEEAAHSLKFVCPPTFTGGPLDPQVPTRIVNRNLDSMINIILPASVAAITQSGLDRVDAWIIDDTEGLATFPSPIIRTVAGDMVHAPTSISLNTHTIHWHGIEPTPVNDGVGHTSFEVSGNFTYQFLTHQAGTFFYHCHKNTVLHFENGLYGLFVVDPPNPGTRPDIGPAPYVTGGAGFAAAFVPGYPGFVPGANVAAYDVEALWVVDEFDSIWHDFNHNEAMQNCDAGDPNNPVNFTQNGVLNDFIPDILFITGVIPEVVSGSPANPPIITAPITPATPTDPATTPPASLVSPTVRVGETLLVRLLNAGYTTQEYTLGLDAAVIATDGHAFGIPDSPEQYSAAFVIPAGTSFHLTTARRIDLLIRPTTPGTFLFTAHHYDWQKTLTAVDPGQRLLRGVTQAAITVLPPADATAPVIYEAENAVLGGGAIVSSAVGGFTGTGFVDFVGPANEFIEWSVNGAAAGLHTLEFRYALAAGNRPLRIEVNGVAANPSLGFPATGSFTTWGTVSMVAPLNLGANTVRATSIGASGANVDHLQVTPAAGQILEAEEALLGGGAIVSSAVGGFTGAGFVDFVGPADEFIEWSVTGTVAVAHQLQFRYALATGNRPLRITVNGAVVNASLAFPATGSFTTWGTVSMTAPLNVGANTVRATTIGSSGPNVDHLFVAPVPAAAANVFEAEDAVLGGGAVVSSAAGGFSGTGFVDFVGPAGEFIEWTANVAAAGSYNLAFRYALAAGNRPLRIEVNGVEVAASLGFPATGSFTTWRTVRLAAILNAGNNTVRATSIGSSGANVDYLEVTPDLGSFIYEAEDAQLGGGAIVSAAVGGFTGTGFVDFVGPANEFIEWSINTLLSGEYELQFRYALAAGNRPLRITVNGVPVGASLAFPATGGFDTWSTVSVTVPLSIGVNVVRATSIGSSGANVDHLNVIGPL